MMIVEVLNNIIVTPLDKYPRGALDYDFRFERKVSEHDKQVDRWLHGVTEGN
jgi:hypothetical protein